MRFILPALLAATALAAPAPASNTATCSLDYEGYLGTWTVLVGRPFVDGKGCDYVKSKIHDHMVVSSDPSFKCTDDGSGNTKLEFSTNVKTSASDVNQGLQDAYPMIDFVSQNTCWPYDP